MLFYSEWQAHFLYQKKLAFWFCLTAEGVVERSVPLYWTLIIIK